MRFLFLSVAALLFASLPAQVRTTLPDRVSREVAGVTIEYSLGDEAYAALLADRLPGFSFPPLPVESGLTLAEMMPQRASYLDAIARRLALKEPAPKQVEIFDIIGGLLSRVGGLELPLPRRYSLWRRPELLARLQAGEKIPGFTLAGASDISFSMGLSTTNKDGAAALDKAVEEFRQRWIDTPIPIAIAKDPDPAKDIEAGLKNATGLASLFRQAGQARRFSPFALLHESTEFGIVDRYIASRDRRWFCDGMANYIAWKVLEDRLGAESARGYYDLAAELKKFEHAGPVDLEGWPARENAREGDAREDLGTAHYAFATKVIADVCAKHGDELIPRLFAEIGKTPKAQTTMQTVYAAFTKLTGEDMRSYLPKPRGAAKS
jgi:hypothetical protein